MKEVTMAFRVEEDLRESFHRSVTLDHRPASQVLRDFMRAYVEQAKGKPQTSIADVVPSIDPAERRRREEAVNFARASMGLEGFKVDASAEELAARFVRGDTDLAAFIKESHEHARAR